MTRNIITVLGGTGRQGGGVVDALLAGGAHAVRVPTRNPDSERARALAARGVEIVPGDLLEPASLGRAFAGAHGAFVVTDFWDPAQGAGETAIATAAVAQARAAGVAHLVWSTLPDVAAITGGAIEVAHFTGKARVDDAVRQAGFARHTFVQAPFYFQNFQTMLAPQPLPGGGMGWAVPMDPGRRVIHAGDVADIGRAVAAAFADPALPSGTTLAVCGGVYSWDDFAAALNALGHDVRAVQVPAAVYDTFYPGAAETRAMFEYFEQHTYFGPDREKAIGAASALVPAGFRSFADWARVHLAVPAVLSQS
jgi:uncharacterized protein YbjT (DUF2867 family)